MEAVRVTRRADGTFEMGGQAQGYDFAALEAGGLRVVEAEALDGWGAYNVAVLLEDKDGCTAWYALREETDAAFISS